MAEKAKASATEGATEAPKAAPPKKVFYTHKQSGQTFEIKRRYRDAKGRRRIVVEQTRSRYNKFTGKVENTTVERHISDPVQPKRKTVVVELPLDGEE